jgi:hypothetical protein
VVAVAGLWHGGYWLDMNNGGGHMVPLPPRRRSDWCLFSLIWSEYRVSSFRRLCRQTPLDALCLQIAG